MPCVITILFVDAPVDAISATDIRGPYLIETDSDENCRVTNLQLRLESIIRNALLGRCKLTFANGWAPQATIAKVLHAMGSSTMSMYSSSKDRPTDSHTISNTLKGGGGCKYIGCRAFGFKTEAYAVG